MERRKNKNLLLHGTVIAVLILSLSCRDKRSKPVKTTLKGTFVSVGNVPFNTIAFRTVDGKTYQIKGKDNQKYTKHQGEILTVEGIVGTFIMWTADGKYKRKVLYIKDLVIIKDQ